MTWRNWLLTWNNKGRTRASTSSNKTNNNREELPAVPRTCKGKGKAPTGREVKPDNTPETRKEANKDRPTPTGGGEDVSLPHQTHHAGRSRTTGMTPARKQIEPPIVLRGAKLRTPVSKTEGSPRPNGGGGKEKECKSSTADRFPLRWKMVNSRKTPVINHTMQAGKTHSKTGAERVLRPRVPLHNVMFRPHPLLPCEH